MSGANRRYHGEGGGARSTPDTTTTTEPEQPGLEFLGSLSRRTVLVGGLATSMAPTLARAGFTNAAGCLMFGELLTA